jgi:hypothetical protein
MIEACVVKAQSRQREERRGTSLGESPYALLTGEGRSAPSLIHNRSVSIAERGVTAVQLRGNEHAGASVMRVRDYTNAISQKPPRSAA